MSTSKRVAAVLSVLAAALLFTGCAVAVDSTPPTTTQPTAPQPSDEPQDQNLGEMSAALLDEGRMFAVTTWGSSTCVPQVESATAKGQTVTVTLADPPGDTACTMDMVQRASVGELPSGVDPTKEVTLNVTHGDVTGTVDADGLTTASASGTPTENKPSAGWLDDGSLVLLTWGSSGCPPVVESLTGSGNAGTVTFTTEKDQVCTADMAPRATILTFTEDSVDDDNFALTLVGGGLDGTVKVAS